MAKKYANLKELQQAYAKGEVTDPLMLDNDWAGLYQDDEKVFDSDPETLLRDALDLLGISHEHV